MDWTQSKYLNSVNYPPQPTPSPSPKQSEKCGLVYESASLLIEHNNLSDPQYYYETPMNEEEVSQSEILDLDSQKVVSQTWEKENEGHTVQGMISLGNNQPIGYQGEFVVDGGSSEGVSECFSGYEAPAPQPPAPAPTKSTNWKSNQARRPKTYNCTACNKWFTSSGHLKRHYNTSLHKKVVKSSGLPDPAIMPISAHHHPARNSSASKDNSQEDSRSSDSVVNVVPTLTEQYPNELTSHVTQDTFTPSSTTGDLDVSQPLPSFAQVLAELHGYANVAAIGQYYCPLQEYPHPVIMENYTTNLTTEFGGLEVDNLVEEQKENPPSRPSEEGKIKCYDCDKVFNTFHSGDEPFKCSRCGKRFPDDETYKRHTKKHAGDKPHKCDMCPKTFNYKADLRRHLCSHTDRKPYACEICGKGFIRKDHMIKHVDTHTRKRDKMAAIRS